MVTPRFPSTSKPPRNDMSNNDHHKTMRQLCAIFACFIATNVLSPGSAIATSETQWPSKNWRSIGNNLLSDEIIWTEMHQSKTSAAIRSAQSSIDKINRNTAAYLASLDPSGSQRRYCADPRWGSDYDEYVSQVSYYQAMALNSGNVSLYLKYRDLLSKVAGEKGTCDEMDRISTTAESARIKYQDRIDYANRYADAEAVRHQAVVAAISRLRQGKVVVTGSGKTPGKEYEELRGKQAPRGVVFDSDNTDSGVECRVDIENCWGDKFYTRADCPKGVLYVGTFTDKKKSYGPIMFAVPATKAHKPITVMLPATERFFLKTPSLEDQAGFCLK